MRLIDAPKTHEALKISPARDILKLKKMFPGLLWHGHLRVSEPRQEAIPVFSSMLREFPPETLIPLIRKDVKIIYPALESIVIQRGRSREIKFHYYERLKVLKLSFDPSNPAGDEYSPAILPNIHMSNRAKLEEILIDHFSWSYNRIPVPDHAKGHPFYLLMLGGLVRHDPYKGGKRSLLDEWMIERAYVRDIGYGKRAGRFEYTNAQAVIEKVRNRVETLARRFDHVDFLQKVLFSNDFSYEHKGELYMILDGVLYSDKRMGHALFNSVITAIESALRDPVRVKRMIDNLWHVYKRDISSGIPREIYSHEIAPILESAVRERRDLKKEIYPWMLNPPFVPVEKLTERSSRATVDINKYTFDRMFAGWHVRKLSADHGGLFKSPPEISLSLKGRALLYLFKLSETYSSKPAAVSNSDLIEPPRDLPYGRVSFEIVNNLLPEEWNSMYLLPMKDQMQLLDIYERQGETALFGRLLAMGLMEPRLGE